MKNIIGCILIAKVLGSPQCVTLDPVNAPLDCKAVVLKNTGWQEININLQVNRSCAGAEDPNWTITMRRCDVAYWHNTGRGILDGYTCNDGADKRDMNIEPKGGSNNQAVNLDTNGAS